MKRKWKEMIKIEGHAKKTHGQRRISDNAAGGECPQAIRQDMEENDLSRLRP